METSPIDPGTFAELRDTVGVEFAAELVDTFFEEAPLMLAELRTAVETADADTYRRTAHALKSNAATFGATALAALAREAELEGFTGAADTDSERLDALDVAYRAAATELGVLARG
jgi:HPt (histidine-containing phosphotransfer) domain-containing protein